ncbi:MAG: HepT-like ribonuclease domain-containing protein [Bacteroidota bacterium]
MTRKQKKYLFDILQAIRAINEDHLGDITSLEVFSNAPTNMRAVERELEIIGEAAYRLRQAGIELTQSDALINRRNTIIHQHDSFQPKTIWYFVQQKIPLLEKEVSVLLEE